MIRVADRRCWLLGWRVHHGAAGCVLATCGVLTPGIAGPVLVAVGLALMFHDRRDLPWTPTRAAV